MDSKWWAKAEVGEALEEVATNGEVDQKEGGGGDGWLLLRFWPLAGPPPARVLCYRLRPDWLC